jgi:hypothetical protein
MHPQIRQKGLGSCPICGMALEPVVATVEDASNPELADMTRRFWVAAALSTPLLVAAMAGMLPSMPLHSLGGALPWARAGVRDAGRVVGGVAVLRTCGAPSR